MQIFLSWMKGKVAVMAGLCHLAVICSVKRSDNNVSPQHIRRDDGSGGYYVRKGRGFVALEVGLFHKQKAQTGGSGSALLPRLCSAEGPVFTHELRKVPGTSVQGVVSGLSLFTHAGSIGKRSEGDVFSRVGNSPGVLRRARSGNTWTLHRWTTGRKIHYFNVLYRQMNVLCTGCFFLRPLAVNTVFCLFHPHLFASLETVSGSHVIRQSKRFFSNLNVKVNTAHPV